MTESPQSAPTAEAPVNPWADRGRGVAWIVLLHLLFLAATWSVRLLGVVPEADAQELLTLWVAWLWLLQGIYVFPAVLSAALVQRWQLMAGMLAAAGVTAVVGGIAAALG